MLKRVDALSQHGFFQKGIAEPPTKSDVKATSKAYAEQLKQKHDVKTPKESREEAKKKEAAPEAQSDDKKPKV